MVRFTDTEHARFLTMYEQSGLLSKATFIKARVFGDVFRVIKTDRGTLEYVAKLTQFHAQFRAIGTNYNQIVKLLHTHFSERKALALLYKLENETRPTNRGALRRIQKAMAIFLLFLVLRPPCPYPLQQGLFCFVDPRSRIVAQFHVAEGT